jgi:prepilin-type N-terminal cleavage/methylation domain-containing protein
MKRVAQTGKRGFTLTEVIIATFLFFIVAVSSLQLLAWGVRANALSINSTDAMNTAQDKMEELLGLGLDNIIAGSDVQGAFSRSWLTNDQGLAEAVRVTVSWSDVKGAPHSVSINNIAQ